MNSKNVWVLQLLGALPAPTAEPQRGGFDGGAQPLPPEERLLPFQREFLADLDTGRLRLRDRPYS